MTYRRFAGLALAVSAAAALWLGLRGGGSSQPASQMIRIAVVNGWSPAPPFVFYGEPYLWLNRHEILHFRGSQPLGFSAVSYDTLTQTEKPEPTLSALQTGHVLSASPDGQWVLWDTQQGDDPPTVMAATRRSDGKTVRWRFVLHSTSAGFWLPDSRRWAGFADVSTGQVAHGRRVLARRLVVYSIDRPEVRPHVLPGDTGAEYVMGVTPQGKIILTESFAERRRPSGQNAALLPLREVSISGLRAAVRPVAVSLPAFPASAAVSRFYLSPQGDRLLWSCLSFQPPTFLSRARGLLHRTAASGMDRKEVWVCRLDGSAPTRLGIWTSSDIGDFAWNPDGRHVSVTIQNKLYSVSVP